MALILLLAACGSGSGDGDDGTLRAREAVDVAGQGLEDENDASDAETAAVSTGDEAEDSTDSVADDSGPRVLEPSDEFVTGSGGTPPTVILEPAEALPGAVAGWDLIDSFFWETGGSLGTGCDALTNFIGLEEWGLATEFYLRDGLELALHATEVNTVDRAELFRDTAGQLPQECPTASFDGTELIVESLDIEQSGFAITVPDNIGQATWLFEPGTRVEVVVLQREAVVAVVAIHDRGSDDNTEDLLEISEQVAQGLAQIAPQ